MPKVSVIMPVHNEPESFLRASINSILKQSYKDFEFIIINDASVNNTEEIILSYDDERIRYYKNDENLKVIKTLNKGLRLATGEYIARMDADDISFRTRFEKQVEILDTQKHIGLINSQCYILPDRRKVEPPVRHDDIEKVLKYSVNCIVHPSVMFRNSIIKDNGLEYSEDYIHVEDYKLWIDMCKVTQLYTIAEPLVLHRDNVMGVSRQNILEQSFRAQSLVFESILDDVGVDSPDLKQVYKNYLLGMNISKKDWKTIDTILSKALSIASITTSQNCFTYLCEQIQNHRAQLRSKAV